MTPVVGVDGCPGGWIAVRWGETVSHHLCARFEDVLALDAAVVAVDIPIGLPQRSGRLTEAEARSRLGKRRSSVFSVPSRMAVMCTEYRQSCNANLANSDPPRMISQQIFHIFPKMREVDVLMTPVLQARVHEVHPEVCFWAMNGEMPLAHAKKFKGRPHPSGIELRKSLLMQAGFPLGGLPPATYRRAEVGADDLIDACACAWSARRILEGRAVTFPADPPRDARGLRMAITA
jgi:predicted RNase H-like nuclease